LAWPCLSEPGKRMLGSLEALMVYITIIIVRLVRSVTKLLSIFFENESCAYIQAWSCLGRSHNIAAASEIAALEGEMFAGRVRRRLRARRENSGRVVARLMELCCRIFSVE
jgi:hypothetical protein